MTPTDYCVVLITASGQDEAARIAEAIVAEKLAACVNIVPAVQSVYMWKGTVERDQEALLVVKTSRARFERLAARVTELHSYDVPEVIALDVEQSSLPYAVFLADALGEGA